MKLARVISGPAAYYDSEAAELPNSISARIEGFINKGWHLHGPPAIAFNPGIGMVVAAHSISGHLPGKYTEFVPTAEVPALPSRDENTIILYRLVVGRDDRALCAFAEGKVNEGWDIQEGVAATFDTNAGHMVVAHALLRRIEGKYEEMGWRPMSEIPPQVITPPAP